MADRWFPLCRSEELAPRHVAWSMLLGEELALFRDDAGSAFVWANRCPHRGARLSIGINDGIGLRCRYHGWRFAGPAARCTAIPAHPSLIPADSIGVRAFPSVEGYGYVWTAFGDPAERPVVAAWERRQPVTLRSLFVEAPAARVLDAATRAGFDPDGEFSAHGSIGGAELAILVQPVDEGRAVLHAGATGWTGARMALLKAGERRLARLRAAAEAVP